MRSKTAVIVAVVFILVIGAAALAVNTRILNASSTSDIGRADQVLIPGTLPAGSGTSTQQTSTPPRHRADRRRRGGGAGRGIGRGALLPTQERA
ncbi:hypothetical protein F8M49_25785 [Rhodococcus zopfii]|uniref:Uncharacterized protein n=1 Tax=Rhodococcus zopfii TaxID=43772 RepID=A0ABU3WVC7_9NOCA|nr:hypothetical protein [Rhodococcus zopfii]